MLIATRGKAKRFHRGFTVAEHIATLFDQGVDRSLPPSEVLGRVEPKIPVSSEHDQCGPESEELDSHPGPHSSDVFHFFPSAQRMLSAHSATPDNQIVDESITLCIQEIVIINPVHT